MMKLVKTILSWIYALVIAIRHRLYDWGVYKSYTFSVPVVCVGNITVGGTGKTPMVEYLLANLADSYNIAILSRGYGRSTKGYREVTLEDSYMDVGDEPLQMKLKFPNNTIVVAEDRVEAINRILREHPEVTLILMDDGFQHRRVKAKVNIILVDSTRPVKRDRLLPLGRLRDFRSRLSAAHFFVVTKCSEEMSPLDRRLWRNELRTVAYQKVYFTTVAQRPVVPLFHCEEREEVNYGQHAILLSGIGNPRHFARSAEQHFYVVAKFFYEDHHSYTADDLRAIYAKLKSNPRAIVLMTEKDAVKLRRARRLPEMLRRAMYYQPIDVEFIEGPDRDFIGNLKREIELRPSSKRENEEDKR